MDGEAERKKGPSLLYTRHIPSRPRLSPCPSSTAPTWHARIADQFGHIARRRQRLRLLKVESVGIEGIGKARSFPLQLWRREAEAELWEQPDRPCRIRKVGQRESGRPETASTGQRSKQHLPRGSVWGHQRKHQIGACKGVLRLKWPQSQKSARYPAQSPSYISPNKPGIRG